MTKRQQPKKKDNKHYSKKCLKKKYPKKKKLRIDKEVAGFWFSNPKEK